MWILIIGLIVLTAIAMAVGYARNKKIQKKIESGELQAAPEIVEADAECCGQHEICEKESLLAAVSKKVEYYDDEEYEPVRKPRVFLLILYILLAVPVGLLGILLLIVPTLLFRSQPTQRNVQQSSSQPYA